MLSCGNTRRGALSCPAGGYRSGSCGGGRVGAASLGVLCSDSLKRVDENGMITEDIDRTLAYRVQTPQVFVREQIIAAHELAAAEGFMATDDCGVAQHAGIRVRMVDAAGYNIKITTPDDLELARALLGGEEG